VPVAANAIDSPNARAATRLFRKHGGFLRMADALRAGVHRRTLYQLRDAGVIEQLSRGLYQLTAAPSLGNPDLVAVALRVPKGVVCLISALAFHELITQIPHEVSIAVPRNSEPPRIDYPPVRVFRFSPGPYAAGFETRKVDGVAVRIYSREKTLADCFKHRNKLGLDTCLEAVRLYRRQGRVNATALMQFARVCRVSRVMQPYLEAML
jgi:predicted transcriptional regulator of viral defense system